MARVRVLGCALAAVLLAAGCGGPAGGVDDGGRDRSGGDVVTIVVGRTDAGGDASGAGDAATSDALDGALHEGVDEGPSSGGPDAVRDAPDQPRPDASPDEPALPDAPPVEGEPDVARDVAAHEIAPLHDTRPKYLGTYAPAAMGSVVPAIAADGSTYLAGTFDTPTDFDPGTGEDLRTPTGNSDGFVTKLGPDGGYLWTKTFGGPSAQTLVTGVAVSGASLVVSGGFTDEIDFDPDAGLQNRRAASTNDVSGFVLRLTPAGAFAWVSTFTGTSTCQANGVALDADGSVYVAGSFDGFCDLDPGDGADQHVASGNQNGFLVKLAAADGRSIWAKSFDGDTCDGSLASVTTAGDGSVWATGHLSDACSLAGQSAPTGATGNTGAGGAPGVTAAAIAAFTPDGAPSGLGAILGGVAVSVAGAVDGSVYVGGWITGVSSTDLDPGPGVDNRVVSPGADDPTGFVLKLGPGGAYRWAQATSRITTLALAATDDGGVIVLGWPVTDAQQTVAFTLTKRDPDGSSPWGIMVPGKTADPSGLAAGSSTFAVTGTTSGLIDLDPGSTVDSVRTGATFASRYSF